MKIRQAATYAIHQAKEVVDVAYHEAGTTAIFDANPFERRFRDVNTVTQQVQGTPVAFRDDRPASAWLEAKPALGVGLSQSNETNGGNDS